MPIAQDEDELGLQKTPEDFKTTENYAVVWDPALCVQEEVLRIGKDTSSLGKEEAHGEPI